MRKWVVGSLCEWASRMLKPISSTLHAIKKNDANININEVNEMNINI